MMYEIPLPKKVTDNLSNILNILAGVFEVPAVVINRSYDNCLETIQKSNTVGNVFNKGKMCCFKKLFCTKVIEDREILYIDNSLLYPQWKNFPAPKKHGMYSFYGIPLCWPDETIFGAICMFDKLPIKNSKRYAQIFFIHKSVIEKSLKYIFEVYNDNKKSIDKLIKNRNSGVITENDFEKQYEAYFEKDFLNDNNTTILLDLLLPMACENNNHINRLVTLGKEFGKYLGLEKICLDSLKNALKYHDIGNILINEDAFKNRGILEGKELDEVKKHTEIGYRILNNVKGFQRTALHVLYHHENWDGSGYPSGLMGEEITYLARIIRVIDSFDAITYECFNRFGIRTLTKDMAVKEIRVLSGSIFDKNVVEAFIEMLNKNPQLCAVYLNEIKSFV